MTAQEFLIGLKNHLQSLSKNVKIENWVYIGETMEYYHDSKLKEEVAFRFQKNDIDIRLRSIPEYNYGGIMKPYIVAESYSPSRQLVNLDLTNAYIQGKPNRLIEKFYMSRTKLALLESIMRENGFSVKGSITEFEDGTVNYEQILIDILKWVEIREIAKIKIAELKKGILEIEAEEIEEGQDIEIKQEKDVYNIEQLNHILFGPPGTGKTYNTINYALHFLEGESIAGLQSEESKQDGRQALRKRFETYKAKGQIVFTTFHQSFTYEDFVEGIKPVLGGTEIAYEIRDGIFKEICSDARGKRQITFESAYENFKAFLSDEESLDLETPSRKNKFKVFLNGNGNTVAKPYTEIATEMTITRDMIKTYIETGKIRDWKPYLVPISEYFRDHYWQKSEMITNQNYVLIIDEINRGNVSQIFGELITLIETDKRQDGKEAISLKLPYSQLPFSVPSNLYILGTMNTADRSVEALDTALRRRFSFIEIPPKVKLLKGLGQQIMLNLFKKYKELKWENSDWLLIEDDLKLLITDVGKFDGNKFDLDEAFRKVNFEINAKTLNELFQKHPIPFIDFEQILETLNWRIEKLLNKDHCIGHAHFLKLSDSSRPFTALRQIFSDNIIPLLQEYFYNDYESIGMVLGEAFIKEAPSKNNKGFGQGFLNKAGHYEGKKVYSFTDSNDWNTSTFTSIYEN
jgi:5-methylcytosine-specific restriction endonuclease McrBC GTP-binding regulatory subunit McrB